MKWIFDKLEKKKFQEMLSKHGKAFASSPDESGCVHPSVVAPMVIFKMPHVLWYLKPILVPQALLPKLIDFLKDKVRMGILERSIALTNADDSPLFCCKYLYHIKISKD